MRLKKSIILSIIIVSIVIVLFFLLGKDQPLYLLDGDTFSYFQDRPISKLVMTPLEEKENWSLSKLHFTSRPLLGTPTEVYGLLFIPKNIKGKVSGVVLLPGGGGTKEGEARLADILVKEGLAVLTFDQRGIGETTGKTLSFEQDFQLFLQKNEPQQHLMVYDVLAAFDILKNQPQVDSTKVIIIGESMGGRYGIIATALDPRIKGVIVISSAGFNTQSDFLSAQQRYLSSIDPSRYLSKIAPRPLAMLHAENDSIIPLTSAQLTIQKAKEPKKFFLTNASTCNHGYCDAMHENLKEALKFVLQN
ncbi:MAG: alpha/beta hydrolase [Nanoarchaeota archaeon]